MLVLSRLMQNIDCDYLIAICQRRIRLDSKSQLYSMFIAATLMRSAVGSAEDSPDIE